MPRHASASELVPAWRGSTPSVVPRSKRRSAARGGVGRRDKTEYAGAIVKACLPAVFRLEGANELRCDERDECTEEERREAVEDEREDDREPVARLHEPEEGHVLADQEADERDECDHDRAERRQDEDQVADGVAE